MVEEPEDEGPEGVAVGDPHGQDDRAVRTPLLDRLGPDVARGPAGLGRVDEEAGAHRLVASQLPGGRLGPGVAALPGTAHLAPVFAAISVRRPIAFAYRGRKRQVDPWRLSFRNGHWYLAGHDHDAGGERMFRLDRVESEVEATGAEGSFERPPHGGAPPPPWEMGGDEPLTARLLVDAGQAGWAAAHVGADAVESWRPDGSVVLTVRVTNRDAFRSFVLGILEHADVLDPPELRAETIQWLNDLAGDPQRNLAGDPCPS